MPTEIKMPQLGESVHEGTIGKWLKRPGDRVTKYEPLVEVITDKVNVEMPSPFSGVLGRILVEEGQTVATGTAIALIEAEGRAAPAVLRGDRAAASDGAPGAVAPAPPAGAPALRLSPLVRRLAEEHRLGPEELAAIPGTGTGGRVTKDDVLRYLETRPGTPADRPGARSVSGVAPAPAAPAAAASATAPSAPAAPPKPGAPPAPAAPGDRLVPLSVVRRAIADRMARSAREIPHAYGMLDVDVTGLVRHREAYKAAWRAREGVNVSLTAFLVRAATRALRAYPVVNSTFTPEGILLRQAINVGVGVAAPDGLIVPVIRRADERSVVGIARELEALAQRARQAKLQPDDIAGGTFTLTNAGVYGSIYSLPIINHPQAAILSVDAVVRRPAVVGEGIAIREMLHLGLGFDHRIFDGALAMQFLMHVKRQLEEFAPVGDSPEF